MATVTWTPNTLAGNASAAVTPTRNGSLSTSDTYRFLNDGTCRILAEKTGATDCTVTIVTPATVRGVSVTDSTYTCVATTGDVVLGPFSPDLYNDADGYLSLTLSNITGLTMAVTKG